MPRADAFATIYFFHPLRRLFPQGGRLPILMYHSVSDREEQVHPYYRTVTSPEVFARQMKYLHESGYSTLSLSQAVSWLQAPGRTGERPMVITFDDGFQDFYASAFPILSRYGFSATMFLPTAYIGVTSRSFNGRECLTWGQVRELERAGIEFGSHTVTHPQLKTLDSAAVAYEVRTSKAMIEQELGCAVKSFAYPYAFPEADRPFTKRLRGMIDEAGYENGVSTILGTADRAGDKLFMKRLPMNSCDDARLFRAKLEGAYDWLHTIQYASKLVSLQRS
jgi:peptidoglycan/xylan/chitin deacetylase (PgdA/CDA1 family)